LSGSASAAWVYVGYTGNPGDYTCDGTNDEVQISAANAYAYSHGYEGIWLKAPATGHTYTVDNTVTGPYTGKVMTGNSQATLKLRVATTSSNPVIQIPSGANHVRITNFTIHGGRETSGVSLGDGYWPLIEGYQNDYITVDHMNMIWGASDGLVVRYSDHVLFEHNTVSRLGHDACYVMYSDYPICRYNTVLTRTNSACRYTLVHHGDIYENVFYSDGSSGSTGPLIQITRSETGSSGTSDIEIWNNTLYANRGAGIWCKSNYATGATVKVFYDIYIHNNIIYNTGTLTGYEYSDAGIVTHQVDNLRIENNVFDNSGAAALKVARQRNNGYMASSVKFTIYFKNNIIISHTKTPAYLYQGSSLTTTTGGAAILNSEGATHTIISKL
jgi:hypothetical protein